jgi:hypothetical protein
MAESESIVATAKVPAAAKTRADGESRPDSGGIKPGGPEKNPPTGNGNARPIPEAKATVKTADTDEDARTNAEIEALALEEARVAALVRERAERQAKAKAEIARKAAEQAKLAATSPTAVNEQSGTSIEAIHPAQPVDKVAAPANAYRITPDDDPPKPKPASDVSHFRHGIAAAVAANGIESIGSLLGPKTRHFLPSNRRVWHYTCEGDRVGPVSFEELKKRAADSLLDPRLDRVWKKGMDEWTPAGRIDGLFEHLNAPPKPRESLAKPTVPLQPTQRLTQRLIHSKTRTEFAWPGARRRSLLLATMVFPLVWKHSLLVVSPFLIKQFGIILMGKLLPLAALVPLGVAIHFGLKRLTNLGMSRWWMLAACIPGLNLWLGYRCFACPPGFARHQKWDGPGIALAAVYWTAMAAVVWMLIFKPAKLIDMADIPQLQKHLRSGSFKK